MAKTKKTAPKTTLKKWREKVAAMLETNFSDLKKTLGDKKFEKNIRKASKKMLSGVSKKTKTAPVRKRRISAT